MSKKTSLLPDFALAEKKKTHTQIRMEPTDAPRIRTPCADPGSHNENILKFNLFLKYDKSDKFVARWKTIVQFKDFKQH